MRRIKVNRAEIKEMMDRKERMDMVKKIAAIRIGIEETRNNLGGNDRVIPKQVFRSSWSIADKRDVVLSSWRNYCRESWLYRVLEFIGLR